MPAGQVTETQVTVPNTPPAAAPAPTPAKSSPPPATATTSAPSVASGDGGGDFESAFDKLETRFKPAAKPDKPAAAPGKPDTTKPAAAAKPDAKPADKPAPTKDDRQFQEGPKQLREKLEATSKERDESVAKIKQYEAKIAEFESRGKDTSALTEQLTREQKEKESLQAEIRVLKKEVSPEFREKWDRPFEKMVGHAMNDLKTLSVQGELDPETGERKSPDRPAAWDDFQLLYQMPLNKAIGASRKMFSPEDSSIIEYHLQTLKRFDLQRNEAREEEKAHWKENESKELAQQAAFKEKFNQLSTKTRQDLINEHPDWYDEDPADPDGNALLKLGKDYLEYVPKTDAEAAKIYERNKLNAIALPRMADRLDKAKARIAELEAQIEEFKGSGPGTTRRASQSAPSTSEKSWEEEIREAAQG